ncbi:thiamine pyrophosphate-dependent dehydrogenase E1 component subunit alpha [Conexibacter sp. JD483]|uniref:thiamine pyrophosphate-dependent dehydrogenase E1 component subunit alpha n=1 Tax=unclassified Conexibacter TaxID=2627773 RepID=UPI0027285EAE|nr:MULTISPECIES: thiamine pyrophosphate-dependent dehydrogenase E1 component subunit alpha [unclassified Conexibacter]MDO8184121.1 thiamine pyrophosphate-dependent dehydrogenase E1 component subunit alpha [Conexibacter sp. CPCC 205706]MDO8197113.1 thiamine pyrophosphate-dependent dehydrogenase E1 component subunit alpha [Conexibacter sp. CPCC 205762]MDR9367572.1 thiamine pyrophosphate-dependent dehydrogenase E1 component subunit alpha [Conexibacter sp. JD483]
MSAADLYRTMRTIRRFEEQIVTLVNANEIAGVTHEYIGQEAVATGVCAALRDDDVITSTHRGHGHVIAKGADVPRMMAELLGRTTGLNRARGGSMHIADVSLGIYGANGIVAAGAPIAAGAAWAGLQAGSDRVAVCFFGDGAVNQGVLHETMNMAGIWRLPVLFVCENNGYAVSFAQEQATAGSLVERAAAYGMAAVRVDGMDVEAVRDAAGALVAAARAGGGPAFLECETYRFVGHHTAEATMGLGYRSDEEIARWRERDPLLVEAARLDAAAVAEIDASVEELLERALAFARESPRPEVSSARDYVYASGLVPREGVAV